jgi:putative hydrolase of the HAD superfamily
MTGYQFILFDAANTLIHKPDLWPRMTAALATHGITVDSDELAVKHKLLSELVFFPDNTSAAFYKTFNAELLYSLGIIPTDEILDDIFAACTYLEWKPFEDTQVLRELNHPKAILSNFNKTLAVKINSAFGGIFDSIITSEEMKCAKPSIQFYELAIDKLGCGPEEILYIGDSIKLDMEPAIKCGMQVCLIDRLNAYPKFSRRIKSLSELASII